jgi:hypothetical protein
VCALISAFSGVSSNYISLPLLVRIMVEHAALPAPKNKTKYKPYAQFFGNGVEEQDPAYQNLSLTWIFAYVCRFCPGPELALLN